MFKPTGQLPLGVLPVPRFCPTVFCGVAFGAFRLPKADRRADNQWFLSSNNSLYDKTLLY